MPLSATLITKATTLSTSQDHEALQDRSFNVLFPLSRIGICWFYDLGPIRNLAKMQSPPSINDQIKNVFDG
jgi:hypothetical protein